jgi:hypothetical protein
MIGFIGHESVVLGKILAVAYYCPGSSDGFPTELGPPGDVSTDDALRPVEANLVEIEIGKLRADVMNDARDRAQNPELKRSAEFASTVPRAYSRRAC